MGEAEIDGDAAGFFFGQPVRICARKRFHQRALAVIHVAGRREDKILFHHCAAPNGAGPLCGSISIYIPRLTALWLRDVPCAEAELAAPLAANCLQFSHRTRSGDPSKICIPRLAALWLRDVPCAEAELAAPLGANCL